MLYANDLLCPVGPSWRAYLSLRKLPQWYIIPCLIEDCARRGGCCGLACGCCSKLRSSSRTNSYKHYRKMCGCCLQARGLPLDKEQEKLCQPKIDPWTSSEDCLGLLVTIDPCCRLTLLDLACFGTGKSQYWKWRLACVLRSKVLLQSNSPCYHGLDVR